MIEIDLREIPVFVINRDSQPERLEVVTKVLDKIGVKFNRFEGVDRGNFRGCTESHFGVLSDIEVPSLVLEDDVEVTSAWKSCIEVPDVADAIYLGVSNYGDVKVTPYSQDWNRVEWMLASHAILYLSDVFVDEVRDEQTRCLQDNRPWDVGMASLLENFTVLTPVAPYFYQTGRNEGFTNRAIAPTPVQIEEEEVKEEAVVPLSSSTVEIDLREIPIFVINLDSQRKRLKVTTEILTRAGLSFERFAGIHIDDVYGTSSTGGRWGCAKSHFDLMSNNRVPFLILEDDIELTPYWKPLLQIPADADAVYLGITNTTGGACVHSYNSEWNKIEKMHSAHAILYLNQDFVEVVKEVLLQAMETSRHWDVEIGKVHNQYNIYTPIKPYFYQRVHRGTLSYAETNIILKPSSIENKNLEGKCPTCGSHFPTSEEYLFALSVEDSIYMLWQLELFVWSITKWGKAYEFEGRRVDPENIVAVIHQRIKDFSTYTGDGVEEGSYVPLNKLHALGEIWNSGIYEDYKFIVLQDTDMYCYEYVNFNVIPKTTTTLASNWMIKNYKNFGGNPDEEGNRGINLIGLLESLYIPQRNINKFTEGSVSLFLKKEDLTQDFVNALHYWCTILRSASKLIKKPKWELEMPCYSLALASCGVQAETIDMREFNPGNQGEGKPGATPPGSFIHYAYGGWGPAQGDRYPFNKKDYRFEPIFDDVGALVAGVEEAPYPHAKRFYEYCLEISETVDLDRVMEQPTEEGELV